MNNFFTQLQKLSVANQFHGLSVPTSAFRCELILRLSSDHLLFSQLESSKQIKKKRTFTYKIS